MVGNDLGKKQSAEPNLQFWFGEGIRNIPDIRNEAEIELPHMQHVTRMETVTKFKQMSI